MAVERNSCLWNSYFWGAISMAGTAIMAAQTIACIQAIKISEANLLCPMAWQYPKPIQHQHLVRVLICSALSAMICARFLYLLCRKPPEPLTTHKITQISLAGRSPENKKQQDELDEKHVDTADDETHGLNQ